MRRLKEIGPPRYMVGGPIIITRKNHTSGPLERIPSVDTARIGQPRDFAECADLPGLSCEATSKMDSLCCELITPGSGQQKTHSLGGSGLLRFGTDMPLCSCSTSSDPGLGLNAVFVPLRKTQPCHLDWAQASGIPRIRRGTKGGWMG